MTFDDIVGAICKHANLTSADAIERVGQAVNRVYKRVTLSIGVDATARRGTVQAQTSVGSAFVTFTGLEKVTGIKRADGTPLIEVRQAHLEAESPGNGVPTRFAVYRLGASTVTVQLDVVTAEEVSLQATGYEIAETLSGDQVPAIPESYHYLLIEGVLLDELRRKREFDAAKIAKAEFEDGLSRLRLHAQSSAYARVRQGDLRGPSASGTGAGTSPVPTGFASYTQTGLVTFDRDPNAPFAVAPGSAPVDNLDLMFLQSGDDAVPRSLIGKARETLSVTDFGAVGDGTTDDTAAIQATLDEAAARGGAVVLFPAGTYLFMPTLTVGSFTTLEGVGRGSVLLVAPESTLDGRPSISASNTTGVTFRRITLDANRQNQTSPVLSATASSIRATNATDIVIEHCTITNTIGSSIRMQQWVNGVIRHNTLINASEGNRAAIYGEMQSGSDHSRHILITGNVIDNSGGAAGGIKIAGSPTRQVFDLTITHNQITAGINTGAGSLDRLGIELFSTDADVECFERFTISDNIVRGDDTGQGIYGISVGGGGGRTGTVAGNAVENCGRFGIEIIGSYVSVTGNTVRASGMSTVDAGGRTSTPIEAVTWSGNVFVDGVSPTAMFQALAPNAGPGIRGLALVGNTILRPHVSAQAIRFNGRIAGTIAQNLIRGDGTTTVSAIALLGSASDVSIDGNSIVDWTGNGGGSAINISATVTEFGRVRVQGNHIQGFPLTGRGIFVTTSSATIIEDLSILDNQIYFAAGSTGRGIYLQGNHASAVLRRIVIDRNRIIGSGESGTTGIHLASDGGSLVTGVRIAGNHVESVATAFPVSANSVHVDFDRNRIVAVTTPYSGSGAAGASNTRTVDVADFPDADFGVRLQKAIAALPSTGGIVDARSVMGSVTIGSNATISKAGLTILLGRTTLVFAANVRWTFTGADLVIEGQGDDSCIDASATTGANGPLRIEGARPTLTAFKVIGSLGAGGGTEAVISHAATAVNATHDRLTVINAGRQAITYGATGLRSRNCRFANLGRSGYFLGSGCRNVRIDGLTCDQANRDKVAGNGAICVQGNANNAVNGPDHDFVFSNLHVTRSNGNDIIVFRGTNTPITHTVTVIGGYFADMESDNTGGTEGESISATCDNFTVIGCTFRNVWNEAINWSGANTSMENANIIGNTIIDATCETGAITAENGACIEVLGHGSGVVVKRVHVAQNLCIDTRTGSEKTRAGLSIRGSSGGVVEQVTVGANRSSANFTEGAFIEITGTIDRDHLHVIGQDDGVIQLPAIRTTPAHQVILREVSALADGDLSNGEFGFYIASNELIVKAKDSGGTVRTLTIGTLA